MSDRFKFKSSDLDDPAEDFYDVNIGDTLDPASRALFIGGGGSITVKSVNGSTATFFVTGGTLLPIRVVEVTGGTATGIVALV